MRSIHDQHRSTAIYDETIRARTRIINHVTEHVDEAVEKKWIRAYFQPITRVQTGELYEYETLARWIDPGLGFLSPDKFIPPLESSFQVHRVDFAVLDQAAALIRERMDRGEPVCPVSFNVSRTDFESCDVFLQLEETVHRHGIPRELVHVEITESAMNNDERFMREAVSRLHGLGYEVWMDDFGSGFSSLNVLASYAFDVIKLDMIFLRHFDENSRSIVKNVVSMCHELGMRTLAEGVETAEQLAFLREIGCDYAQGYLFSRPLPPEEIVGVSWQERLAGAAGSERAGAGRTGAGEAVAASAERTDAGGVGTGERDRSGRIFFHLRGTNAAGNDRISLSGQ